jgi:hypothetical protein
MSSRHHLLTATAVGLAISSSGLLAAAPASAAMCVDGSTLGSLAALGTTGCEVGDKTYYGFETSTIDTAATVSFFNIDPFHTITVQAPNMMAFMPGTDYMLKYKMKLTDSTSSLRIKSFSTGATTSAPGTNWTKMLTGTSITPAGGAVATAVTSPTATSPNVASVPPSLDISFESKLTVGNQFVTSFTDSVQQAPIDQTPAPLPILGAGAAFGFSRKLRRRLRGLA